VASRQADMLAADQASYLIGFLPREELPSVFHAPRI